MNFKNIIKIMLKEMPELLPLYEKEMEWLEDELHYVIFGCVFNPYLIQLLSNDSHNKEPLKRAFEFIEQMADSDDEQVQQLLIASVLESLVAERELSNKVKFYMGKKTVKIYAQLELSCGMA